jgi:hypothetical protein
MRKLQAHGLTVENIHASSEETVREVCQTSPCEKLAKGRIRLGRNGVRILSLSLLQLIFGVGFGNKKAVYIKSVTQILHDEVRKLYPCATPCLLSPWSFLSRS